MSKTTTVIPNIVTVGNLFCGFLAIIYALKGHWISSAWLIILAAFLDAFDGKVARVMHSASRFGVELDSLADLCSFGLAPSILLFQFQLNFLDWWGILVAFIFFTCGAMRLARFNVKLKGFEKGNFAGLPIPSAASVIASYIIFSEKVWNGLNSIELIIFMTIILSVLMISSLEYDTFPRFTFNSFWNTFKVSFFVLGVLAIVTFPDEAFFPLCIIYVMSGPIRWVKGILSGTDVANIVR